MVAVVGNRAHKPDQSPQVAKRVEARSCYRSIPRVQGAAQNSRKKLACRMRTLSANRQLQTRETTMLACVKYLKRWLRNRLAKRCAILKMDTESHSYITQNTTHHTRLVCTWSAHDKNRNAEKATWMNTLRKNNRTVTSATALLTWEMLLPSSKRLSSRRSQFSESQEVSGFLCKNQLTSLGQLQNPSSACAPKRPVTRNDSKSL